MGNGFHTPPYSFYFEEEPDYAKLKEQIKILDTIAEMHKLNICVIDFYKHNYFYVGENHFFFEKYRYSKDDMIDEGAVDKFMHEQDRDNQLRMKDAAFSFFMELDSPRQKQLKLYSTHRLRDKDGNVFLLSNQHKPFLFDDNGNIWMIISTTSISTKNHHIEAYIEDTVTRDRYIYNARRNKFILTEKLKLTSKELDVLRLTIRGFTAKEIAEELHVSSNTVKFHKKNIISKMNAQNMSEAILYAYSHNLL